MASYRVMAIGLLLENSDDIPRSLQSKMLYSLGVAQMELSCWRDATNSFRQALKENVLNVRAWVRLGESVIEGMKPRRPLGGITEL